jgi:hypothetical protein
MSFSTVTKGSSIDPSKGRFGGLQDSFGGTGSTKDFPDDVSDIDDTVSVFSYTTNSTHTTSYTQGGDTIKRPEYIDPKVAVKEQLWVVRAKLAVAMVLLTAMMAMASATFLFIKESEHNDFVNQVRNSRKQCIMYTAVSSVLTL